jgi:hypothetical protein
MSHPSSKALPLFPELQRVEDGIPKAYSVVMEAFAELEARWNALGLYITVNAQNLQEAEKGLRSEERKLCKKDVRNPLQHSQKYRDASQHQAEALGKWRATLGTEIKTIQASGANELNVKGELDQIATYSER